MGGTVLIIGLLALFIPIGAILGFRAYFGVKRLEAEVAGLQRAVRSLRKGAGPQPETPVVLEPSAVPERPETVAEDIIEEPAEAETIQPQEEEPINIEVDQPERPDIPDRAAAKQAREEVSEARPALNLEQAMGGKWTVWVGGIALAFGSIFLVRYSIEQGLLDPQTRLVLGFLFSLTLVGLGEWTRRRGSFFSVPGFDSANIPATLTAAGTMGAFASMYVAYGVFGFIGPLLAFVGMAIVAVGALVAALLHGPALAALGLLGAYGAPFLVASPSPVPWTLAIYALFVSAAALAVARWRYWQWLAIAAGVGLILFALVLNGINHPFTRITIDIYLVIAFAMLAYVFVISIYMDNPDARYETDRPATALLSGLLLATLPLILAGPVTMLGFAEIAATLIAGLGLVYFFPQVRYLALATIAIVVFRYLSFDVPFSEYGGIVAGLGSGEPGIPVSLLAVKNANTFIVAGFILAIYALAIGAWGAAQSRSRILLAISGTVLPFLLLVIAWMRVSSFAQNYIFFFVALALLAAFAFVTRYLIGLEQEAEREEESDLWPATIFITAAFATLALAVSIVLEKGFLTIALALIVPAIAYVQSSRPMPGLKPLAVALMAIWALRVVANPSIVGRDLGTTPIFNWLLYGWGISSAAFAAACVLFTREDDENDKDNWLNVIEGITIAAITVTIAVLLTHAWDPSELFTITDTLAEAAFLVLTGGAVALGLLFARRDASLSVNIGVDLLGYGGMALAIATLVFLFNPMVTGETIQHGLIFNALSLGYLVPALLYFCLGWFAKPRRAARYTLAAFATSGILGFLWISLLIRKFYHTGRLDIGVTSNAELYTYSIVWLAIGIALLIGGLVFNNQNLRKVSAGLIVLVILKAFFIDMANLTGILRALSFIGLGGVLVAVGLVYQRLLVGSQEQSQAPNEPVDNQTDSEEHD